MVHLRRHRRALACVFLIPVLAGAARAWAEEPRTPGLRDLDFLIGRWEVDETILPGQVREYRERGSRECRYELGEAFIRCESETTISTSGKKRHYAYLISYDDDSGCFWATAVASDFPRHALHQWRLDRERREIRAITPQSVNGDRFFRGVISFADRDRIVWQGWASRFSDDKEWELTFRDVARRVP
jgi:hypothetical protein